MAHSLTPEQQQLLETRAARVGRSALGADERTERMVTFRRGTTSFALAAADLRGVRPLPALTRLPQSAAHVLGVVNLGGHALGVVDLERFVRASAPPPSNPWAVWLASAGGGLVLVADEMLDVVDVPERQLTTEVRGAFSGTLATVVRAVLPGPLLALHSTLLLNPELYRP